jgi:hypothetical protein
MMRSLEEATIAMKERFQNALILMATLRRQPGSGHTYLSDCRLNAPDSALVRFAAST